MKKTFLGSPPVSAVVPVSTIVDAQCGLRLSKLRSGTGTRYPRHALMGLFIGLGFCGLTACTSLIPHSEAVRQFVLSPALVGEAEQAAALWPAMSVRVAHNSRFDTNRLLMLDQQQELLLYRGARWALPLPELIRDSWGKALEQGGITVLSYVEGTKQGTRPALVIHLRDFQADLLGANQANCHVAVVLEFLPADGAPPQSLHLSAVHSVATTDPALVAAGFDHAYREVVQQSLTWLRQQRLYRQTEH